MGNFKFEDCYARVTFFEDDQLKIPVVNIKDLIRAKRLAGRHKDLDDIEQL